MEAPTTPRLPSCKTLISQVDAIDSGCTKISAPIDYDYGRALVEFSRSERLSAVKRFNVACSGSFKPADIDRETEALNFVRAERARDNGEEIKRSCTPTSHVTVAVPSSKRHRGSLYESDLSLPPTRQEFQETVFQFAEPEDALPPVLLAELEQYSITRATSSKAKFEDLFFRARPDISTQIAADAPSAKTKDVCKMQSCGHGDFCLYADAVFFESYVQGLAKDRKIIRIAERHFNQFQKIYFPSTKPLHIIPFRPVDPSPTCIGVALTDILEMKDIYMEDARAAVFQDIPLSSNWINLIVQFYDDEPTEVVIVVWCECSEITRAKLAMEIATAVYDYFETSEDGPSQIVDLRLVALINVDQELKNWVAQYAVVQGIE
ncbi:hypothetical protein Hypma_006204 [Hypsizygus marmoreus]|uniref:Uncharacterized protein n=1 Tax=Hypsizygus marmoreus TaxID=39966 RepID=A0A369JUZ6_HYPMA|nr:hypothetical protein Hypma_006204 [Hypsizygus marmoreus]